jgi:STE24 endopeptidase
MHYVLPLTGLLIVLRLAGSLVLSALNRAEVRRHAGAPPPAVAAVMDAPTYARAVAYTLAKSRFEVITEIFDAFVLGGVLFSGVLPRLFAWVSGWSELGTAGKGAAFMILVMLLLAAVSLPFDAWDQFSLEARFGFSRTSVGLWLVDKAKLLALSVGIGFPVLWALLNLVRRAGPAWWIWGWVLIFGFQLVMLILYPLLILPLFNRLTPLPEGDLRTRLVALGERTGYRTAAIQVIDGSKRSAHSNAYFSGFGRFRRIVLYDTLIAQLTPEELEAVLAHEIGHYRCGHLPQRLVFAAVSMLAGLALLGWLAHAAWFSAAFGFPPGAEAPTFLLFGLLSGLVTFWFSPLGSLWSRHHEFQADAFARRAMSGPESMIGALRKLSEKNLSNLTPHPWFSAFYYSHPTIVEREAALRMTG